MTTNTMRELRIRGGCYGKVVAIIAYDIATISTSDAVDIVSISSDAYNRNFLEGNDCETCGYNYREFVSVDDTNPDPYRDDIASTHTHNVNTCGHPYSDTVNCVQNCHLYSPSECVCLPSNECNYDLSHPYSGEGNYRIVEDARGALVVQR